MLIKVLFVLSASQVLALEACTTMPAISNILLEHKCGCVLTHSLGLLVGYKDGASNCHGDYVAKAFTLWPL